MTGFSSALRGAAFASLILSSPTLASADVKVHGATTVTFGLMRPHQADIERLAGVKLAILPSSTSHGLMDLVQAKADIAMLAEPLEDIAAVLNRKQPGFMNVEDYVGRHVANAYVQLIVHPSNPLRSLSNDQLAGLFSGRIRNWSEIGGANVPVLVVGEPTSSPYRMIREALDISYAPDMRVVQNANQTAIIVAQAPGAISYLSTAHDLPIRSKLKFIDAKLRLPLALHLAIRKDAPPHVKKVVDAAASIGMK
jgi:phosphate transport system substrate-binding protein